MRRSTIGAALVLMAVTGCGFVEPLTDPPVYVDLEIHNRTLDNLVYTNADGQRVEVPGCESLLAKGFSLDTVEVRAPGGYVRAFGAADAAFAGRQMHLVELPNAAASGTPELGPAPAELPPCDGHAEAQPGT